MSRRWPERAGPTTSTPPRSPVRSLPPPSPDATKLHTATTADLAQQVESQLLDASPIDASVRNHDFWANHAHRLAWVTLYAARMNNATMRDVIIYASTQTLFLPWEDSRIVANAELDTTVTLDWLYDDETDSGSGRNTLYVGMPEHPKDAARFAVVFGGLISALADAAYEKRNRENKPLPNLLLVLDEAGNTAATWLPQISTTCA